MGRSPRRATRRDVFGSPAPLPLQPIEGLRYREELCAHLKLTDVRIVRPVEQDLVRADPEGLLHRTAPDTCCYIRKTLPLEGALKPFAAWITGRKRFQSPTRANLPLFEEDSAGRIKVNPLASWDRRDLSEYMRRHQLPTHPLVAQRYLSIGCQPCTSKIAAGEDERAGRWRGTEKDECGIHIVDGKVMRPATLAGSAARPES
jgi:phosphoadenosine phosphosulfate reductase